MRMVFNVSGKRNSQWRRKVVQSERESEEPRLRISNSVMGIKEQGMAPTKENVVVAVGARPPGQPRD